MNSPDADGFGEQAWPQHMRVLLALARDLVADEHSAEDLVQEACLRFLVHPPRSARATRRWLSVVVRHLASNHRFRERERPLREGAASRGDAVADEAGTILGDIELRRRVARELAGLREPYRTSLHLRYLQGLSVRELSNRTAAPEQTVKTRLGRGLLLLRSALDRREPV